MKIEKFSIKEINKTGDYHPTTWEGILEDGRIIYVRYKSNGFSFGIGKTLDEALTYLDDNGYLEIRSKGNFSQMSTETMLLFLMAWRNLNED